MDKIVKYWICLLLTLSPCLCADKNEEFLRDQVCNLLPSLEGWCSQEKALAFIDLVLDVKPKVCVEIGVFGGASLFPIASALKFLGSGIVIGIDVWDRQEACRYFDPVKEQTDIKWWNQLDFEYVFNSYWSMLKRYGLDAHCVTVRASSERAIFCIPSIDILHLDGNHSEKMAILDVQNYLPKVRPGGYIWLNDALWEKKKEAFRLLSCECDLIRSIDHGNCLLFQKR